MNITLEAKSFFKIFFSAHETFMRRPTDFILGVVFIGLVIRTVILVMESIFPAAGNGFLLFFEGMLYLSMLGAYFAYPLMTHIINNVKHRGGMDWKYELKSFMTSPISKISKAVSGGFIFGVAVSLLSFVLVVVWDLFSFVIPGGQALTGGLTELTPKSDESIDVFKFLMVSISIVPVNWLINALFVKTFFPSKEFEAVYIRTTASLILILICLYTILSWLLSYIPSDLEVIQSILGSVFLIYFISLVAINDHSVRANEKGDGPFVN